MREKLIIGSCLFAVAGITLVLSSHAPLRVLVTVLASWLVVVASASLVFWSPGLRSAVRISLLAVILLLGAWMLAFSVTRVVLSYQMTTRTYLLYLGLSTIMLGVFFLFTWGIARLLRLIKARQQGPP